ncbi:MAG: hypothetical protein FWD45_03095 [Coriobacteriia bacterium]|nr:hypothetical protein [Coriobacteriia bacterium]
MHWGWINTLGLAIVALMLIPNIVFAYKNKAVMNNDTNKALKISEQIGRYGSMALMVLPVGIPPFGFRTLAELFIWLVGMFILVLTYWVFWYLFSKTPHKRFALSLAVIPCVIFLFHGVLLRHWLLIIFGVVFSVSHITITNKNYPA